MTQNDFKNFTLVKIFKIYFYILAGIPAHDAIHAQIAHISATVDHTKNFIERKVLGPAHYYVGAGRFKPGGT